MLVVTWVMMAVMGVFIGVTISDMADTRSRLATLEERVVILREMLHQVKCSHTGVESGSMLCECDQ